MKRTFDLVENEEQYILRNTNPNEKKEPFLIDKTELKFDSRKFYMYVFDDIEEDTELELNNMLNSEDKAGKRIYDVINDVLQSVMDNMKQKVFE